jgi:predicted enzyme related to lactoylglutathione lyase
MTEQDRYIPGVPCWIDTTQPDPEAAVAFYGELFGWEFEDVMPPGSPGKYFIARLRGGDVAAVGSQWEGGPPHAVWNSYVWVADADETAAKVRAAGGSVIMEPADVMEAGRSGVFADPAGAVFSAWQPGRHRGAAVVNEHGSLNFNILNTRDVDGARAFYGAVFGWELLDVGGAGPMWALPAYGDFLEQRTPGLRARTAEMGAPARFEEVVAGLTVVGDDTAYWGVTFGVDDADAIASRAAELGGEVVVAPFDAPWVRMTVIADPQGAVFTASRFTPENKDLEQTGSATAGT